MPVAKELSRLIGEQLVKKNVITAAQLKEAIEQQQLTGRLVGEVLVSMGHATEDQVTEALSEQVGIPFMDMSTFELDEQVLSRFPEELLREHTVLPLCNISNTVTAAMADPLNIRIIDRLRFISRCEIQPVFGTKTAIQQALDRYYGRKDSLERTIRDLGVQDIVAPQAGPRPARMERREAAERPRPAGDGGPATEDQLTGLIAAAENAPVVKLVDAVIRQAVESRASDIHLNPEEDKTFLRFRIDGVLYDMPPPPKTLEAAIVSRIKIMANMDIAERRLPQDGRIQVQLGGREVDLRVATFPTIHGENVALRVLDKGTVALTLEDLGFDHVTLVRFEALLQRPHGILLVTGPTGCGKTTTLYGALRTVNAVEKNIITLEDPVEYRLPRIRQCQVDVKAGLTFANGLRSILRQDPDIILIGEIRDLETAEIAIHSALTGHLVFSTLHTNDAPGALTRLVDMQVEPFLVASSVIGVLAQRLVRTLCMACREPYAASPEVLESLGLSPSQPLRLYRTKGCEACRQTGYRGRSGVFELMPASEAIQALLLKKSASTEIREQAIREGMVTLRNAGVAKALAGITAVEEVLRVTEHDFEG